MKIKMLGIMFVVLVQSWGGTLFALTEKDVLFHASFNGDLKPEIAQGNPTPQPFGKPEFAEGRNKAKALVIENRKSGVIFDLPGNLNPRQGTISFWISTQDWKSDDLHVLQDYFSTSGPRQFLKIQHIWWHCMISMLLCKEPGGVVSGFDNRLVGTFPAGTNAGVRVWDRPMQDALSYLRPGVWFFLTYTWRDGAMHAYLNGEPGPGYVSDSEIALTAEKIGNRFAIGANDFNVPVFIDPDCNDKALPDLATPRHTLISDFTILDRCLLPLQVKTLFQEGALQYAHSGAANPVELFVDFYPSKNELTCKMLGAEEGTAEVRVQQAAGGNTVLAQKMTPGEASFGATLDTRALPVGIYSVKGILFDKDNKVVFESAPSPFEKESPRWLNNHLGEQDVVLPPWTELKVQKTEGDRPGFVSETVDCWGRTFTFNSTLFPTQISSQGKPLLARPVELWCVAKGQTNRAVSEESQIVSSSTTRTVRVEKGRMGDLDVECKTTVEYDGLAFMEMTLTPQGETSVDSLTWELPLKPEFAGLFHAPNRNAGLLPEHGWQDKFAYTSHILWLGDDQVGLQWFSDSDEGWVTSSKDESRQIEILPGKSETLLRVNVIHAPTTLRSPLTLKFGLMPTPVKPLPSNWRVLLRMAHERYWWQEQPLTDNDVQGNTLVNMGEWYTSFGSAPRPDYMTDEDWTRYKESVWSENAKVQKLGIKPVAYSVIYWCGAHYTRKPQIPTREFRIYGKEWANIPFNLTYYDYFDVCPAAPGFGDWWVDNVVNIIIDKNGLNFDGIYYDGGHAIQSCNLEYGCGYKTKDGVHPTFTVMANRILMRRMYAAIKAKKPDAIIITHSSCEVEMPQMAFVDAILQGEDYSQPTFGLLTSGGHYSKCMPLDYGRAVASTSRMGIIPWYMGELESLGNAWKKDAALRRDLTREFMAGLYLNDVHAIGGFCDLWAAGWQNMLKVFDYDFGIKDKDVQFRGYWENSRFVSWEGEKSYVSLWHKPQAGLALLIVANFSDADGPVKLKLDPKALNLSKTYTVRDGETGEALSSSNPEISVSVRKYDFRLIIAEPSLPAGTEYLW